MDISRRISRIMEKMEKLSAKHPEFSCGKFPPEWDEPLTEQMVEQYEKENGIVLPRDYRSFLTTAAAAGHSRFMGFTAFLEAG